MPHFEQDAIKTPFGKDTIEISDRFGEYIPIEEDTTGALGRFVENIPTDTIIFETSNGLEWLWIFGVVIIVLGIIIIIYRFSIKRKGDQTK